MIERLFDATKVHIGLASCGSLAACLLFTCAAFPAKSAEPPEFRSSGPDVRGGESLPSTLPNGAYQTPPVPGVAYSRLFRNTGAPYSDPLNPISATPSARTESIEGRATFTLPIRASFPLLQRGFEPQDADLKLGPVFFKLHAISGAVLWSDNINLRETERESGTIGIVTISGAIIAQFTEGVRLALSGSLVYLPLQNEAGIAGFGVHAPYVFGLENQPVVRSEITWNTMIGGWNVVFADDFHIGFARFSNNVRDDAVLFQGGGFDGVDRAGRYSFRANDRTFRSESRDRESGGEADILYYSNIVSAQADRLVVGKTRLRFQAAHENLWYNQGNRGLPGLRDQASVSLISERENLRFKPFLQYHVLRTELQNSFDQTVRAGFDGPITDQLQLNAETGYYFGNERDSLLWRVGLRHQAGPYTQQSLYFFRSLSGFHDEVHEGIGYNIRQVLGPKVVANAFVSRSSIDSLESDGFARTEYRTGLNFAIAAGPKTTINLTGTYTLLDSEGGQSETWTSLAQASHYITDTFLARLMYQYQRHGSDFRNDSYYENLIFFSLTTYFN